MCFLTHKTGGIKLATTLGKNIKKYREGAGLTQEELANKLGYERTMIARAETGKDISSVLLNALADEFDCTADELLGRK